MKFTGYTEDDVSRLIIAARAALLQNDASLAAEKMALQKVDETGTRQPFNIRELSLDDRTWIEGLESKRDRLNAALCAFGAGL